MNYTPMEDESGLEVCHRCGCVVDDVVWHDQWHEDLGTSARTTDVDTMIRRVLREQVAAEDAEHESVAAIKAAQERQVRQHDAELKATAQHTFSRGEKEAQGAIADWLDEEAEALGDAAGATVRLLARCIRRGDATKEVSA